MTVGRMFDKLGVFVLRVVMFFGGLAIIYGGTLVFGHQSSAAFEVAGAMIIAGGALSGYSLFGGHGYE